MTKTPFVRDETDARAEALAAVLLERGHEPEVIQLPFRPVDGQQVLEHLIAIRLLRLPNVERMVALGFPAYCVAHPHKVVWSLQEPAFDLGETPEETTIGEAIAAARVRHLAEARQVLGRDESPEAVAKAVVL